MSPRLRAARPRMHGLWVPFAAVLIATSATALIAHATAPDAEGGAPVDRLAAGADASQDRCRDATDDPNTTRFTADDRPLTDAQGRVWSPATALTGGRTVEIDDDLGSTASPQLYRRAREGASGFLHRLPRAGTYAVDVLFAERADTAPGQRVFDIRNGDDRVTEAQDATALIGPGRPFHSMSTVTVGADRCLDLRFVPVAGQPLVAGIELAYLGDGDPRLLWADEFDGPTGAQPDPASWQHEVGGGGWGNDELQTYTDDPTNAHLDGAGHLAVVARRDTSRTGQPHYTSAKLITKDRRTFTYGRIEVVAQLPVGKGLWPGLWALGADIDDVGFPGSGEIDVMESAGGEGSLLGHIHGPDATTGTFSLGRGIDTGISRRFATYSAQWTPLGIEFLVDGRPYMVASRADAPATGTWVFDKPFYLLITFSVGGRLVGPPDDTTPFPSQLLLDSVRVWSW